MPKKIKIRKLTSYDPAEDLGSDEAIAMFMAEAFLTNDAGYISHALGVVARAKGMAQIASQTGLSREQLYRSFSEKGNPTLKTTLAVMKALVAEKYRYMIFPEHARGLDVDRDFKTRDAAQWAYHVGYARAMLQTALMER